MAKDDIILDEQSGNTTTEDFGRSEMGLDDLQGKWIKTPQVGADPIEFTVKKIYKLTKDLEAVDPITKKTFSTALSGTNYGIEIETDKGEKLGIRAWEVFGKVKAIFRALGKIEGVKLRITHLLDGMKRENKDKEIYKVEAFVSGSWKTLDKQNAWHDSE